MASGNIPYFGVHSLNISFDPVKAVEKVLPHGDTKVHMVVILFFELISLSNARYTRLWYSSINSFAKSYVFIGFFFSSLIFFAKSKSTECVSVIFQFVNVTSAIYLIRNPYLCCHRNELPF